MFPPSQIMQRLQAIRHADDRDIGSHGSLRQIANVIFLRLLPGTVVKYGGEINSG